MKAAAWPWMEVGSGDARQVVDAQQRSALSAFGKGWETEETGEFLKRLHGAPA